MAKKISRRQALNYILLFLAGASLEHLREQLLYGGIRLPIIGHLWGILASNSTKEHERCHDRQIVDYIGDEQNRLKRLTKEIEWYQRYLTDNNFACQRELECGGTIADVAQCRKPMMRRKKLLEEAVSVHLGG